MLSMSSIILLLFASVVLFLLSKAYSMFRLQRMSNSTGQGILTILKGRRFMFQELADLWEKEKVKPEIMHFWAGPRFGIVVSHPESAQFVLKSVNDFPKETNSPSKYIRDHVGTHLVTVNGEDWKRHRTFVNAGFSTKAYNEYYSTFCLMTEKTLSKMDIEAKNGDIEIRRWFSKFTLDLLGNSIFHHDFGRLDNKSTDSYDSYTRVLSQGGRFVSQLLSLFPWMESLPLPPVKRLHEAVDNIESLFHQIIKERQSGQKFGDILENLLKSQTEGSEGLSQTELISNLWIFFLAGHETTSTALTYECICLAKYPDIQETIYQEILKTIGNREPTLDDLSKLTYLDCFIHETLRLFPPVPFLPTRTTSRDVKYKDHVIPKGTMVALFIGAIHKHPDFWPNPEKFDPDRFLPENKKGRHHYAYLPFSVGPRQCIGNIFSLIEQRLFLTRLLQKYRVLPPKNSPLHTKQLGFISTEPVMVYLEQR